jgi:hypothetical protein
MAKKGERSDLFGRVEPTPRGWTELDKLRKRYAQLERRVVSGDYESKDLEDMTRISGQITEREKEAREKWAKSFRA